MAGTGGSVSKVGLAFHVGSFTHEVGTPAFLRSFFSTVFVRLEPSGWGSRFPTIMRDLYGGELTPAACALALEELATVQRDLAKFNATEVVWDHEHRDASPPWAANISPHIKNLADYFVTSSGKPLLDVLAAALEEARRSGCNLKIQ